MTIEQAKQAIKACSEHYCTSCPVEEIPYECTCDNVVTILKDLVCEYEERIAIMRESMEALEKRNEPMLMAYIGNTADEIEVGICPVCNKTLANDLRRPTKYCKFCGQAVRWND